VWSAEANRAYSFTLDIVDAGLATLVRDCHNPHTYIDIVVMVKNVLAVHG